MLNEKLKLNSTKIKVPSQRRSWIYICFRSEKEKINALNVLNKYKWKGFVLRAEEAKPVPDPLVQKRALNLNKIKTEEHCKKIKLDERELSVKIKDATTPLWKTPYAKQVSLESVKSCYLLFLYLILKGIFFLEAGNKNRINFHDFTRIW